MSKLLTKRVYWVADGRQLPGSSLNRLCGNAVCPDMAEALVAANFNRDERRIAA